MRGTYATEVKVRLPEGVGSQDADSSTLAKQYFGPESIHMGDLGGQPPPDLGMFSTCVFFLNQNMKKSTVNKMWCISVLEDSLRKIFLRKSVRARAWAWRHVPCPWAHEPVGRANVGLCLDPYIGLALMGMSLTEANYGNCPLISANSSEIN